MTNEQFWRRVVKQEDGCWIYQHRGQTVYPKVMIAGRQYQAHRYAYLTLRGPVPEGLVLDHLCRRPRCCNPDHLEPVTIRENTLERGQGQVQQVHRTGICSRGHSLADSYQRKDNGKRECRLCRKERQAAFRQANPTYYRDRMRERYRPHPKLSKENLGDDKQ